MGICDWDLDQLQEHYIQKYNGFRKDLIQEMDPEFYAVVLERGLIDQIFVDPEVSDKHENHYALRITIEDKVKKLSDPEQIHRLKIQEWKKMIIKGEPQTTAAESVGYANFSEFAKIFQKYDAHGRTPWQFQVDLSRGKIY